MRIIIKGVAPTATPIREQLEAHRGERVIVFGLNDQRSQPWWVDHKDWDFNHHLQWFQLHGLAHMVDAHGTDYLIWLSSLDCKLWMFQEQIARWEDYVNVSLGMDVPAPEYTQEFPVQDAVNLAGRKYITNSFSYQMALSIMQGATDIHLTGINLGEDTAQLWSSRKQAADWLEKFCIFAPKAALSDLDCRRVIKDLRGEGIGEESWIIPNLEFWIGIARGRGINVTVDEGHLFYDKWDGLYGLEAGGEY
jgi:hypothetical protein